MDKSLWDQTIEIATAEGVLAGAPDDGAYTTQYAEAAIELLGDLDVNGSGFSKTTVELLEGGE
jgi:hypothetical protein